jgi:hypothetical protein
MDHGVVHTVLDDGGVRTLRLTPVCAVNLAPPWSLRCSSRWLKVLGKEPYEDERPAVTFGIGNVACSIDEGGKALVGDGKRIDPERLQHDEAHRSLSVGGESDPIVGAHQELATLKAHHARGGPLAFRGSPCSWRCSQRRKVSILQRASARGNAAWLVIVGYIG